MEIGGRVLRPGQIKEMYDEMTTAHRSMSKQARTISDPYKPWAAKDAHTHPGDVADELDLKSGLGGRPEDHLIDQ